MATIRLYIDADVHENLASVLRGEGHDAVAAHELGLRTLADPDVFSFAGRHRRAILTFNKRDFVPLAADAMRRGEPFSGLIVDVRLSFKETHRRPLALLSQRRQEDIDSTIVWLANHR